MQCDVTLSGFDEYFPSQRWASGFVTNSVAHCKCSELDPCCRWDDRTNTAPGFIWCRAEVALGSESHAMWGATAVSGNTRMCCGISPMCKFDAKCCVKGVGICGVIPTRRFAMNSRGHAICCYGTMHLCVFTSQESTAHHPNCP
jgi:hypothetical protein